MAIDLNNIYLLGLLSWDGISDKQYTDKQYTETWKFQINVLIAYRDLSYL